MDPPSRTWNAWSARNSARFSFLEVAHTDVHSLCSTFFEDNPGPISALQCHPDLSVRDTHAESQPSVDPKIPTRYFHTDWFPRSESVTTTLAAPSARANPNCPSWPAVTHENRDHANGSTSTVDQSSPVGHCTDKTSFGLVSNEVLSEIRTSTNLVVSPLHHRLHSTLSAHRPLCVLIGSPRAMLKEVFALSLRLQLRYVITSPGAHRQPTSRIEARGIILFPRLLLADSTCSVERAGPKRTMSGCSGW